MSKKGLMYDSSFVSSHGGYVHGEKIGSKQGVSNLQRDTRS